jgi:hypothetical protein
MLHQVFRLEATLVNKLWARSGFDFPAIFYVFNNFFQTLLEKNYFTILKKPLITLYLTFQDQHEP